MRKIIIPSFVAVAFLFFSCTVTQQTYRFAHHGTDSIKTNANFKYVAKNVLGKAKSTIKISAWNKLKQQMATDGLLAEAKGNLPSLKANQAFANLSIDELTTTKGRPLQGGVNVNEITIEVVVSADIIEYE